MNRFALLLRQGPAPAGALATAAGRARRLPARALAARRRRARRPGHPAARGVRERGRHPERRPHRRPPLRLRRIVRQAGRRVQLVRMTRPQARRALSRGDVVAAIVVPRGFVSDLSSLIASPSVLLLTNRNAYEERILREVQAFVYTLNSAGADRVHPLQQRLPRRPRARRRGHGARPHLQRARPRRDARAHRGRAVAAACRQPGAGRSSTRSSSSPARPPPRSVSPTRRSAATAHPVRLVQRSTSGRSYLLGIAGAELRAGHLAGLRDAPAGSRGAHARARRERARAPAALGHAPGPAGGGEGDAVRDRRLRPRPAARAGLRRRGRDLVLRRRLDARPAAARAAGVRRRRPSAHSAASSARRRAICAPRRSSASR